MTNKTANEPQEPAQKPTLTRKVWIKCALICSLYLLFLIWVKSWWGLLLLPIIVDVYITKRIPWTFWKRSKNKTVKIVMGWVDAIVFSLIAVYLINIYFFQNYQIPSSSLEKTLLIGDFLFVSKASYGARVPNTPLSFPLAQHTLPFFNCKSYLENPQWEYKRTAGFGKIKRNDIVVFNFPAGDTVALNRQEVDYYSLCYQIGKEVLRSPIPMDSLSRAEQAIAYEQQFKAGKQYLLENQKEYGALSYRPVDRRENYVKRCVAIAGDTLQVINGQVHVNGKPTPVPAHLQFLYYVQTTGVPIPDELFEELQISKVDQNQITITTESINYFSSIGFLSDESGRFGTLYALPLTQQAYQTLKGNTKLIKRIASVGDHGDTNTYPLNLTKQWTRNNYGPIYLPKRGDMIQLTLDNLPLYTQPIRNYERNTLEVKGSQIFINGVVQSSYTFKMDYYWMMGDNRDNSADSRSWGFVPEDHVVGKPIVVWLSLDSDKGWFEGKIRWNRIFKWVDTIH